MAQSWLKSSGRRTSVPPATRSVNARKTRPTAPPAWPNAPSETQASSAWLDSALADPPAASVCLDSAPPVAS